MAVDPSDPRHGSNKHEEDHRSDGVNFRAAMKWASLAFEIAAAAAALGAIGYFIDRWLGSAPWGLVVGLMLGLIVGMYNFIKEAARAMR